MKHYQIVWMNGGLPRHKQYLSTQFSRNLMNPGDHTPQSDLSPELLVPTERVNMSREIDLGIQPTWKVDYLFISSTFLYKINGLNWCNTMRFKIQAVLFNKFLDSQWYLTDLVWTNMQKNASTIKYYITLWQTKMKISALRTVMKNVESWWNIRNEV